jgi:hypothetical protein
MHVIMHSAGRDESCCEASHVLLGQWKSTNAAQKERGRREPWQIEGPHGDASRYEEGGGGLIPSLHFMGEDADRDGDASAICKVSNAVPLSGSSILQSISPRAVTQRL